MRAALALPFLLGACTFALDFKGVKQPCDADGRCSPGFRCQDGRCIASSANACNEDCEAQGFCFQETCSRELVAVYVENGVFAAAPPDLSCVGAVPSVTAPTRISGCVVESPEGSTANAGGGKLSFHSGMSQTGVGPIEALGVVDGGASDCPNYTAYDLAALDDGVPRGTYVRANYTPPSDGGFRQTVTERIRIGANDGPTVPIAVVSSAFANLVRSAMGLNEASPSSVVMGFVRDCRGRPVANARVTIAGVISGGAVRNHYFAGLQSVDAASLFARTDRVATGPTGFFLRSGLSKGGVTVAATGTLNGETVTVGSWEFYLPEDNAAALVLISP